MAALFVVFTEVTSYWDEELGTIPTHAYFVILDPKTGIALWGFTERVQPIGMREARERNQKQVIITINRNFDQAMINLVADVKTVAGQPVVSANRAKP